MKWNSYTIGLLILFGLFISCSPSGDEDPDPVNNSNPVTNPTGNTGGTTSNPPGSFSLTFPNNNEVCQEGAAIANQPNKWLIEFKWAASSNADKYEITVVESESGSEVAKSETSSTNQYIEVDKGRLYRWSVKAINEDGEYTSSQWSFYSKGGVIGNFVPYPAYNIAFEFDNNNDLLTVSWDAADEDGDSLTFDVSILENGNEIYNESGLTSSVITGIPVLLNATYQAIITVKDGISSTTKVSQEVVYEL